MYECGCVYMSVGVDVSKCMRCVCESSRCTGILLGVGCGEHVDGCVSIECTGCVQVWLCLSA